MTSDSVDRAWVSRFSQPTFSLSVHVGGVLADADATPTVSWLVYNNPNTPQVPTIEWTRNAVRTDTGTYEITLTSVDTQTPISASLGWDYAISTAPQVYITDLEVGDTAPAYDALPVAWKAVIEQAWVKFADLFDSTYGGPNLQTYIQSKFGRNRLAQLLPSALQRLNSASAPFQTFAFGGQDFPFDDYSGLLSQSLYIETLKHLIRSYTEIPEAVLSTGVSRMDRRDYMSRWTEVLNLEMTEFTLDLGRYRKAFMGLGHSSVLVSGGAFGRFGPLANAGFPGEAAARGYFAIARWH